MVSSNVIVQIGHDSYRLSRLLPQEQIDEAYTRLWKILDHHPIDDREFELVERISKMWYYRQKFHCRYSEDLEKLIDLF
jgi:hypothetical protein